MIGIVENGGACGWLQKWLWDEQAQSGVLRLELRKMIEDKRAQMISPVLKGYVVPLGFRGGGEEVLRFKSFSGCLEFGAPVLSSSTRSKLR